MCSPVGESLLSGLKDVQTVWKDDYAANQAVRKRFREEKKELKLGETKDNELKARGALEISLLPEKPEDIDLAKSIRYKNEGRPHEVVLGLPSTSCSTLVHILLPRHCC